MMTSMTSLSRSVHVFSVMREVRMVLGCCCTTLGSGPAPSKMLTIAVVTFNVTRVASRVSSVVSDRGELQFPVTLLLFDEDCSNFLNNARVDLQ